MVSDCFQTRRSGLWILGKERAEKVLASGVSVDGRDEWTCKICSELNVWTASLPVKYRQAVAAWNGEWSTGSSTSSGEEERRNEGLE